WIHSHNGMHHGWTNLKGKDPVYAPLDKAEFDRLPKWRQWLERVYRSEPGIALLYLVEVWWKQEIAPNAARLPRGKAVQTYYKDRVLVFAFFVVEVAIMALAPAPSLGGP